MKCKKNKQKLNGELSERDDRLEILFTSMCDVYNQLGESLKMNGQALSDRVSQKEISDDIKIWANVSMSKTAAVDLAERLNKKFIILHRPKIIVQKGKLEVEEPKKEHRTMHSPPKERPK